MPRRRRESLDLPSRPCVREFIVVRPRKLIVAAVLLLCAVSASACQSKAGQAAIVDGQRISDSTVAGYVEPGAKPFQAQDGSTLVPKVVVAQTLIRNVLFQKAVAANGGPATAQEIDAGTKAYLSGHTTDELYTQVLKPAGLKQSFATPYLGGQVLLQILIKRLNLTQASDLNATLKKLNADVQVSPRYGAWDAANFALLSTAGSGVPPFVTLGTPTATASATPTG